MAHSPAVTFGYCRVDPTVVGAGHDSRATKSATAPPGIPQLLDQMICEPSGEGEAWDSLQ
jgi:hypothetical protein